MAHSFFSEGFAELQATTITRVESVAFQCTHRLHVVEDVYKAETKFDLVQSRVSGSFQLALCVSVASLLVFIPSLQTIFPFGLWAPLAVVLTIERGARQGSNLKSSGYRLSGIAHPKDKLCPHSNIRATQRHSNWFNYRLLDRFDRLGLTGNHSAFAGNLGFSCGLCPFKPRFISRISCRHYCMLLPLLSDLTIAINLVVQAPLITFRGGSAQATALDLQQLALYRIQATLIGLMAVIGISLVWPVRAAVLLRHQATASVLKVKQ